MNFGFPQFQKKQPQSPFYGGGLGKQFAGSSPMAGGQPQQGLAAQFGQGSPIQRGQIQPGAQMMQAGQQTATPGMTGSPGFPQSQQGMTGGGAMGGQGQPPMGAVQAMQGSYSPANSQQGQSQQGMLAGASQSPQQLQSYGLQSYGQPMAQQSWGAAPNTGVQQGGSLAALLAMGRGR